MSLFEILGTVLIGPLKTLFEVIFSVAYKVIQHPGPAIIVLSLVMNILVLPLYRRADAIQEEARDTENKLKDTVAHIKKTFSGDERMMILQTYYRQNNYNPLSVLSGSISLLLEIPFFMAAYQFLSGVDAFHGVSFGPIADLSVPDGLLTIGGVSINLLPFIMTLVNVVSSALYLKGFPLKTKIQLYGMALFFLVFLYNSPAALVFYWTLNNVFSLVKTLFYRIKNAKKVGSVLLSIAGIAAFITGILLNGFWRSAFMIGVGIAAQLPLLIPCVKKLLPEKVATPKTPAKPDTKMFVLGGIFLTILVGLLIPSTYISASAQEYIDINYFYDPIWYVINTLCLSAGTFLVWMRVFYWLANPKFKILFTHAVWILCGVTVVNYMFFGTGLGVMTPNLQYTEGFRFALWENIINILVILVLAIVLLFVIKKLPKAASAILLVGSLTLTGMSVINLVTITQTSAATKAQLEKGSVGLPSFNLDKEGQNVVVIMLDRGLGYFTPFLFEENPELKEQFDGFTNYTNTLSYGAFTNFATPSLYGGYDYTPVNINLRSEEKLVDKQNEALKVLPTIFSNEGYDVTMIDPSYAGYKWIPDLSIYNDMPGVTAYHADGKYNDMRERIATINTRKRNFFFFSLMKTVPVSLQSPIYDNGLYRAIPSHSEENITANVSGSFMNAYNVLENLDTMTEFSKNRKNTFMFIRSNLTHEPVVLQEPDLIPVNTPDNSAYYPGEGKTITNGNVSVLLSGEHQISHYHVNMKALMQLGQWFETLKENGVYDNTKIIIVSDHGRYLNLSGKGDTLMHDIDFYHPMLMVKDFNAHGFTNSDVFMTNADVPTIATAGLLDDPVNPFTGNPINSSFKEENDLHYVILSQEYDVNKNNGTQFLPSEWAAVSGEVGNKENWEFLGELTLFPTEPEN